LRGKPELRGATAPVALIFFFRYIDVPERGTTGNV
jgi:hypothetical protein